MTSFGSAPTTGTASVKSDYNVPQAGNDGISSLCWSPTTNYLISTNWDGGVRCWNVQESAGNIQATPLAQVNHENQSPVLSSAFSSDGSAVFTGGTDKAVRMWNLGQQVSNGVHPQIGAHNAPVKSVAFLPTTNIVVSGGWDKMLKFWDARQPNPVVQIELPERVYDMDVRGKLMVIATAGRQVLVYDVTGTPVEVSRKESPLKYQTRCVSCFPDQTGYAIGSIEGRVHINYVQTVPNKESFAFKCHRQENNVFSVNALAFHPLGTFATAGSDGVVTFWDKDNKQRLKVFPAGPRPISCARFNQQGNLFAYASSYDWSKGSAYYAPGTPNEIYIHYTTDEDIKSKAIGGRR